MRWIKASERLPEFSDKLIWRFSDKSTVDMGYTPKGFKFMGRHFLRNDDETKSIEWLDESASQLVDGWIDVNERLPDAIFTDDEGNEGCEFVIGARCNDGNIDGVVYADGVEYLPKENKWRLYGDYLLSRIEITHWQPLPEPPKTIKQ